MIGREDRRSWATKAAARDDAHKRGQREHHAVFVQALQLVERQQHGADRQHQQKSARRIEFLARRRTRIGRQDPGQSERRKCERRAEPEHRWPVDQRHQQARDQWSQRATDADGHRVDAEDPDPRRLRIEAGCECRSAAEHECRSYSLQHARAKQCVIARRHRAEHERHRAPGAAGEKDAAVAQHVADAAEHQHQCGVGQRVGDDHPLDRRNRQSECARDVRECEVDGRIERHHQRAERNHQHAEART